MKNFVGLLLSILFTLGSIVAVHFLEKDILFEGATQYTFYSVQANSQAKISTATPQTARQVKAFTKNITGESAEYSSLLDIELQLQKFNAKYQYQECNVEVTSYYFYSPKLYKAINLNGRAVNLHIAVAIDRACIGSPLIFGGF